MSITENIKTKIIESSKKSDSNHFKVQLKIVFYWCLIVFSILMLCTEIIVLYSLTYPSHTRLVFQQILSWISISISVLFLIASIIWIIKHFGYSKENHSASFFAVMVLLLSLYTTFVIIYTIIGLFKNNGDNFGLPGDVYTILILNFFMIIMSISRLIQKSKILDSISKKEKEKL